LLRANFGRTGVPSKSVRKWDNLSLRIANRPVQVIARREDYQDLKMPAETAAFKAPVGVSGGRRNSQSTGDMVSQTIGRVHDSDLIRAAQRGDRAAFESLVRQYDQAVLRLALHLTGSEPDARDIYQEAFLKAYRHIGNFRFECSFYTWIYRIVTNLCLDHLRKRQTRKEDPPVMTDSSGQEVDLLDRVSDDRAGANPERDLMRRELGSKIAVALTRLTPRERMVFELKHYQGLRLRTIGEMLNTTEETAKNTLFRATQKLRIALKPMR
jgi:RNA polymerase sigma-70 factor (ECF subfamily)